MNEDDSPYSSVPESSLVAIIDAPKAIITTAVSIAAPFDTEPDVKKMVITSISMGNLPLHGMNPLVIIAMSLTLRASIILNPTTPAALHPSHLHMVRACLPQVLQHLKQRSRSKAMRGKKPQSSSSVKRGKNIAIGGSITDTTHATTLYM